MSAASGRAVTPTGQDIGRTPIFEDARLTGREREQVLALVGPAAASSDVDRMGNAFSLYDRNFATFAETHWKEEAAKWDLANYYDRAKIYYVWWARTGEPEYLTRANALALDYRVNYVEAQKYAVSAHWAQIAGVALHHLITRDEASKVAVGGMADVLAAPYYLRNLGDPAAEMDNRMQARVLQAFLYAWQIGAPSLGYRNIQPNGEDWGIPGGNDWSALLRQSLTQILSSQAPDGAYRFTGPGQCGFNKPFMVGLLNDALIEYHDTFETDPRILDAVRRSADYLWDHDWIKDRAAFAYLEAQCGDDPENGPIPSPDLNMLIVNSYGWLYRQTGIKQYRDRGDAIFSGGVAGSWLAGSKQFNQTYTSAYKYLSYR